MRVTDSDSEQPIVWEVPPPRKRGAQGAWITRLTPLSSHPKAWARLGQYSSATGSHLRRGAYKLPPGKWEFESRKTKDCQRGKSWLYARYLGE